ncbi:hypothetical protein [Azospirillum humicireducens]|uniref:hypothetical protein n=1 Tax=Azospirillum humicireducens TaxID=1226968 RepID=UPI0011B2984F|nr:hypothetical protein [Azospirillum humicireducens]
MIKKANVSTTNPLDVILLSSGLNGDYVPTLIDHVTEIVRFSKNNIYCHNFVYDIGIDFDFDSFDVIVITHNFWFKNLHKDVREKIKKSRALKIQFLQDEFLYIDHVNKYMNEMGINIICSVTPKETHERYYKSDKIESLINTYEVFTGYVSSTFSNPSLFNLTDRPIDIGYRSRVPYPFLGKLGYEKQKICENFKRISKENGLVSNISIHEEDRLYGKNWIKFLQSCRTQLGTASGWSIVDFNGEVVEPVHRFRLENPHSDFETIWNAVLLEHEGNLVAEMLSPRIWEYASTGSTMVMHEGKYSGVVYPWVHYIPIKKDYSNINDVVSALKDRKFCEKLSLNAHRDLILSGRYDYRLLAKTLDSIIEEHCFVSQVPIRKSLVKENFDNYMSKSHGQIYRYGKNGRKLKFEFGAIPYVYRHLSDAILRNLPWIGSAIRQAGGSPTDRMTKGLASLRVGMGQPAWRELIKLWLLSRDNRRSIPVAWLLRDILLLAIMAAQRNGLGPILKSPDSPTKGLGMRVSSSQVIIYDMPIDSGEIGWTDSLLSDELQKSQHFILWDRTQCLKIRKFDATLIFSWPLGRKTGLFRSEADEYYHMRGLTLMASSHPSAVAKAIMAALKPMPSNRIARLAKLLRI